MLNIMKVIFKILFKRKGFILTTFILPLVLIIAISGLSRSNSSYNIGMIDKDKGEFGQVIEDSLKSSEAINLINLEEGDYSEDIIFHKYEMIVTIDEDYTDKVIKGDLSKIKYRTLNEGEMSSIVESLIENQSSSLYTISKNIDIEKVDINSVIDTFKNSKPDFTEVKTAKKSGKVSDSLGLIFYIIFISSGLACVFLLEDERLGTKDRTIMSKVSEKKYYGAHVLIYMILGSIPAFEYFIFCNLLNIDFKIENKIWLLIIVLSLSLLAVTFNIFITSIIKNKGVYNLVNSCLTIPMFMLSGCFWPYEMMSETLQNVG
ncbi:ABC-2 type transport system permease protein [Clostridium sp. DSM 8431]|uniref:ABC transporter permease n=1 Tax=Clostridium sp. DSM 8431 TaxID=1761781 RepID=UPI0008DF316F|nr:ABC transporter permease [Clostridium sp. DSM 8431]SFU59569.1 ABC-2 type transport system permease protein [Clostridium sp. DSM 8431]